MNQSFDSLRYPPLQTEDELELVNEVIYFPHSSSHSHELMAIECLHIISMVKIQNTSISSFWSYPTDITWALL